MLPSGSVSSKLGSVLLNSWYFLRCQTVYEENWQSFPFVQVPFLWTCSALLHMTLQKVGHSESVLILSICRHRPEHAKSLSLHMWCCSIQKTEISPNCRCLKILMSICSTKPNQKPIHPAFMHDWFYFPYIATSTNSVHGTVIPTPR